jgi:hypothetical protein
VSELPVVGSLPSHKEFGEKGIETCRDSRIAERKTVQVQEKKSKKPACRARSKKAAAAKGLAHAEIGVVARGKNFHAFWECRGSFLSDSAVSLLDLVIHSAQKIPGRSRPMRCNNALFIGFLHVFSSIHIFFRQ